MRNFLILFAVLLISGCFTDPATRLASDLQAAARRLDSAEGARYTLRHAVPSKRGECEGPYQVQLDKVGAIIIWCKDAAGSTVSSHSTSSHRRAVGTAETFILDKPAGSTLEVVLARQRGAAVIVAAR